MAKFEPKEENELYEIWKIYSFYLFRGKKKWYIYRGNRKKTSNSILYFWRLKAKLDDLQQYKDYVDGKSECPSYDDCSADAIANYQPDPHHNEGYD